MSFDAFSGQVNGDDKIVVSKSELLNRVNECFQEALLSAVEAVPKAAVDTTIEKLSSKFDFVPKDSKKAT